MADSGASPLGNSVTQGDDSHLAPESFFNQKSMLTPGIAGGSTMMIAQTLWVQFEIQPKWTALAVSVAFALLVVAIDKSALWQRGLYFVLNTLIVFSVGVGTTSLAIAAAKDAARPQAELRIDDVSPGTPAPTAAEPAFPDEAVRLPPDPRVSRSPRPAVPEVGDERKAVEEAVRRVPLGLKKIF